MILDDKIIMFPPPPPYLQYPSSPSAQSAHHPHHQHHQHHTRPTLTSLPPHILLQIIHHTFPPLTHTHTNTNNSASASAYGYGYSSPTQNQLYQDTMPEKQRKTLFWLSNSLRLVSRQLYTACMHVLRSTYLPSYQSLIRAPYTSDPFPLSLPASSLPSSQSQSQSPSTLTSTSTASPIPPAYSSSSSHSTTSLPSQNPTPTPAPSPLLTIHRETPILDRFIALKVRQDVFADESELHIDREDAYRDLFDVAQPRARLEDLVRVFGVREGVVSVPGWEVQWEGQEQREERTQERSGMQAQTQTMYANTAPSSSSLGSLPPAPPSPLILTPTTSSINKSASASAYTYTLDPSVLDPTGPVGSSTSTSSSSAAAAVQQQQSGSSTSRVVTQPQQRTRRSFFSLSFLKPSSSSSSSPSPSHPPSPNQTTQPTTQPTQNSKPKITPIPFSSLIISFSPRRVGILLNRSRTIVAVPRNVGVGRTRGEPLEVLARALVEELKRVLRDG